jgi:hypothetical protein
MVAQMFSDPLPNTGLHAVLTVFLFSPKNILQLSVQHVCRLHHVTSMRYEGQSEATGLFRRL